MSARDLAAMGDVCFRYDHAQQIYDLTAERDRLAEALAAEQARVTRVALVARHRREQAARIEAMAITTIGGLWQQSLYAARYRNDAKLIEAALNPEQVQP